HPSPSHLYTLSLHDALPISTSDKISLYALAAAESAIRDAHLELEHEDLARVGIAVGTSLGGVISQEAAYHEIIGKNKTRLSPFRSEEHTSELQSRSDLVCRL